ncbi:hypothetical protein P3L10_025902 [Capsicum annuum]
MVLNTRKSDRSIWKFVEKYSIYPRVLEVVRLSGLYGVFRCNRPAIDCSLITSSVERWRPETHTFHFRTGEATITLQDVEVVYGLPMNGAPILGTETTRTIGDWENICQRLLGFVPSPQHFRNSFLKVSALKAHMLDISGACLKLMYLPMLEDVNAIGSYSWVMRQFGLQQMIPTPFIFDSTHFRHDHRARPNKSWELEHAQWLPFWNEREQYIYVLLVFSFIILIPILNANKLNDFYFNSQARHIHSMVDKAKSPGDTPSYEDLCMFRQMVRDQSSDCLRYVHEAYMIHVSADYRRDEVQPDKLRPAIHRRGKGGVAGRRERAIARDQVPVEMNEMDEAMQNAQISSEDDQATTNLDFGSISMGCTQEFT